MDEPRTLKDLIDQCNEAEADYVRLRCDPPRITLVENALRDADKKRKALAAKLGETLWILADGDLSKTWIRGDHIYQLGDTEGEYFRINVLECEVASFVNLPPAPFVVS